MIAQSCMLALLFLMEAAPSPATCSVQLEVVSPGPYYPELPILLAVTVTNSGVHDLRLPTPSFSSRDHPANTLDLFVSVDGDAPRRVVHALPDFFPPETSLFQAPEMIVLPPGGSWRASVVFSHDWDPALILPLIVGGEVRVRASLYSAAGTAARFAVDRKGAIESNELTLTVADLTDSEARALARLRRTVRPWLAAHPAAVVYVPQGNDFRAYQELARMAGAAPYTRHAQVVVAYMLAQGNALDPGGNRAPQPDTARLWIERAMSGGSETSLHPEWVALSEMIESVIASTAPLSSDEESS